MWVSIISAALTICYGVWGVHRSARDQLVAKLADLTFNTEGPDVAAGKASAIAYLFSNQLLSDLFAKLQNFEDLRSKLAEHGGAAKEPPPPYERRIELLRLVLANPKNEPQIEQAWRRMFPEDTKWVDEFAQRQH